MVGQINYWWVRCARAQVSVYIINRLFFVTLPQFSFRLPTQFGLAHGKQPPM